ncbi:MAG: glycoside hydrolase family 2 TIM barrel-domain containing protein [Chitinophagaceae bacterium]
MKRILLTFLFFVAFIATMFAQKSYELDEGWFCKNIAEVHVDGTQLSLHRFSLKNWMPAVVPGTVLTTLLENKKVPDPFFGMNNDKIPDIYFTGRETYTYWFCKDFKELPAEGNSQVWLNLRGINYSCDVYLNGKKLNQEVFKGMFLRQRYNITSLLDKSGNNRLAVVVFPPDNVGNPNGGQGGDGIIAKNVAHQYVAGWDWIQPIRDRNTGIWDKVTIEKTGAVSVENPHIVTTVPGVRQPQGFQAPAFVEVGALVNNTSANTIKGFLKYQIADQTVYVPITLNPKEKRTVKLDNIQINNPRLWWPNTYGPQNLYTSYIGFVERKDSSTDNLQAIETGIREIKNYWNAHTQSMEISVNGQRVFVRGGNWIISDQMLRFSKERYDAEVRFHRDMNLNLIRVWGGALTERPEFYEACDRYGMLVMQDFWGSGDCNGRWIDPKKLEDQWTRRQYPDDHQLFVESAADMIRMVRNYPSLAIWCGGNEITLASDIHHALKDSLMPLLDGSRWFIDYSNSDSMSYNSIGGNGDGPYGIQTLPYFWNYRTWPFNSEIGSVGVGDMASLRRFLPKENWVVPQETPGREAVQDSVWTYHKYIGYGNSVNAYGKPKDLEEFANKAQLVNYDQYRALIEGFLGHQWDWYTGIIIWKTQNPWTALRGQMYDYYLDPNACLYGLKKAGAVLHGMYSPADSCIYIANNTYEHRSNVMLAVKYYSIDGKDSLLTQAFTDLVPQNTKKILSIKPNIEGLTANDGGFVVVQLLNEQKQLLDENIYWLSNKDGQYTGLNKLPKSQLRVKVNKIKDGSVDVELSNPANAPVAFFNRLSIVDQKSGERLLPSFYSDNYVSVLPGASQTVHIDYPEGHSGIAVEVEGWNKANEKWRIE